MSLKQSVPPLLPPNMAALLSPTGVSVNLEHGGGGCPVTVGELQEGELSQPASDYIIIFQLSLQHH